MWTLKSSLVSTHESAPIFEGCVFFGIEMPFLWYRGGLSLLFGIEISFLVSRFCIMLFSIYIVFFLESACPCFSGPRHPVKWRSKKISIPKRRSKHLDTQKKTSRYQLKESPIFESALERALSETMCRFPYSGPPWRPTDT